MGRGYTIKDQLALVAGTIFMQIVSSATRPFEITISVTIEEF